MDEDSRDLILTVVEDADIREMIGPQTLDMVGYRTEAAGDVTEAMKKLQQISPDCLIADLEMMGLSARDLMVMMHAQNIDIPVIVLARKGGEADIIQAFRLGAEDYLIWPSQEPEILNVVERVLKRVHTQRQRERMERQLQHANAELQLRVRELTTIYSVGKTVTSVTDLGLLCDKVLDGAIQMTDAERGWFLLRDDASKVFFLVAHRNLPPQYVIHLHKPWDDGISLLVARAGKMLSIHGELLRRFPISSLGQSILIVPVRAQNQVIGLLAMMHKDAAPFNQSAIHLLEALADYASISLVNARMFLAVEERLRSYTKTNDAQAREKISAETLRNFSREQGAIIEDTVDTLEKLARIPASHWTSKERDALVKLRDQVENLIHLAEATANISE